MYRAPIHFSSTGNAWFSKPLQPVDIADKIFPQVDGESLIDARSGNDEHFLGAGI